jgi:hypothetical protein
MPGSYPSHSVSHTIKTWPKFFLGINVLVLLTLPQNKLERFQACLMFASKRGDYIAYLFCLTLWVSVKPNFQARDKLNDKHSSLPLRIVSSDETYLQQVSPMFVDILEANLSGATLREVIYIFFPENTCWRQTL